MKRSGTEPKERNEEGGCSDGGSNGRSSKVRSKKIKVESTTTAEDNTVLKYARWLASQYSLFDVCVCVLVLHPALFEALISSAASEVIERVRTTISNYRLLDDTTLPSIAQSTLTPRMCLGKGCEFLSVPALLSSASLWRGLHLLDLRYTRITDEVIEGLGKSPLTSTLRKLNISYCSGITDQCLYYLTSLTVLWRLKLDHCDNITKDCTHILASSCTTLQYLSLRGITACFGQNRNLLDSLLPNKLPKLNVLRLKFARVGVPELFRFIQERPNIEKFQILEFLPLEGRYEDMWEPIKRILITCRELKQCPSHLLCEWIKKTPEEENDESSIWKHEFPCLTKLKFTDEYYDSLSPIEDTLLFLRDHCPNLQKLDMTIAKGGNLLMDVLKDKNKLEWLCLTGGGTFRSFETGTLQSPSSSSFSSHAFQQLRTLKISCNVIDPRFFIHTKQLQLLQKLEIISVQFRDNVPAEWVEDLLQSLKYLKTLVLTSCAIHLDRKLRIVQNMLVKLRIEQSAFKDQLVLETLECAKLQKLHICFHEDTAVEDSLLESIAENTCFLSNFFLSPLSARRAQPLIQAMPVLQKLESVLPQDPSEYDISWYHSIPPTVCDLRLAEGLTDTGLHTLCQNLPRLQRLSLANCDILTALEDIQTTSLRHLSVRRVPNLRPTLRLAGAPNLATLSIFDSGKMTELCLENKPLLENIHIYDCRNLTTIQLHNNVQLRKVTLLGVAALHLVKIEEKNLEQFSISDAASLTSLQNFDCPHLAVFRVSAMPNWKGECLDQVVQQCPHLDRLELRITDVTEEQCLDLLDKSPSLRFIYYVNRATRLAKFIKSKQLADVPDSELTLLL